MEVINACAINIASFHLCCCCSTCIAFKCFVYTFYMLRLCLRIYVLCFDTNKNMHDNWPAQTIDTLKSVAKLLFYGSSVPKKNKKTDISTSFGYLTHTFIFKILLDRMKKTNWSSKQPKTRKLDLTNILNLDPLHGTLNGIRLWYIQPQIVVTWDHIKSMQTVDHHLSFLLLFFFFFF